MANLLVTRAAFTVAAHSGDVATVQRYLAQPQVVREMAAFEELIKNGEQRISPAVQLSSWFSSRYQCVWCIPPETRVSTVVLESLYCPSRDDSSTSEAPPLVHTLTYLLTHALLSHAAKVGDLEGLDVLLTSWIYCGGGHMTEPQQFEATTRASWNARDTDTVNLLLAHGAAPHSALEQEVWMHPRPFPHTDTDTDIASRIQLLVESGAYVVGHESIIRAAVGNTGCPTAIVRGLLTMGADPSHALVQAATSGNMAMIELLVVDAMIDIDASRGQSGTAMAQAIIHWLSVDPNDRGLAFEIVELLLRHGGDVNARGGDGCVPLNSAASHMNAVMLKLLLTHGADPNLFATRTALFTVCHESIDADDLECIKLLLQHGADPNLESRAMGNGGKRRQGVTPLHRLVFTGDRDSSLVFEAIKMLVAAGGDLDHPHPFADGTTPREFLLKDDVGRQWSEQLERKMKCGSHTTVVADAA